MKRDRLMSSISAFMDGRQAIFSDLEFPQGQSRRFENRLKRLSSELETADSRRYSERLGRTFARLSIPASFTASIAAAALMLFIWFRLTSVPSVSAREALGYAQRAEAGRIDQVTAPVVHQRVRVTRRLANGHKPESIHWEIWHDTRNHRFSQKVQDFMPGGTQSFRRDSFHREESPRGVGSVHPMVDELGQILKFNLMDQPHPLSATAFANWSISLQDSSQNVLETRTEDGEKTLTVVSSAMRPPVANGIVKAELVLRKQDWHAVEQRLRVFQVDGLRDYEMHETSYEVVALPTLSKSIFGEFSANARLSQVPSPVALSGVTPESQLLDLEVAVLERLHRLKACLGEEIQVVRSPSGLPEVRGVAENQTRKDEILRALAEFPKVAVKIQTLAEAEAGALVSQLGESRLDENKLLATALHSARPSTSHSLLRDYLTNHFAQDDSGQPVAAHSRAVEFSNEIVALSQEAQVQAWALRRLAERYDEAKINELPPKAAALLQVLIRDHVKSLGRTMERCETLLTPVLGPLLNGTEAAGGVKHRPELTAPTQPVRPRQLFESTIEVGRLIQRVFEGTESEEKLPQSIQALLSTVARVNTEVGGLTAQVSQSRFTSHSDGLVAKNPK